MELKSVKSKVMYNLDIGIKKKTLSLMYASWKSRATKDLEIQEKPYNNFNLFTEGPVIEWFVIKPTSTSSYL